MPLHDALVVTSSTTEIRLLIDITFFHNAYQFRKKSEVVWVPAFENPVDAVTENALTQALSSLLRTNSLSTTAKCWVARTVQDWSTVVRKESGNDRER